MDRGRRDKQERRREEVRRQSREEKVLEVGRGEGTREQQKRASAGSRAQAQTVSVACKTGKWQSPFDPDLTKEDLFMVDKKTKV